ncbi:hypothetical protein BKA81DRAFT_402533 [Phyllosticta paracitricarpa]|uniref:Histone-lysine N-methyltransferase n=1 Tax=Phyllosticta paracitricarpa TaxID=2016321 RepID=A0ABR1NK35_9PEZI
MGDANTAVHSTARQPSPQSDLSILSHITGPEAVSSLDASLAPSSTPDTSQADTSSVNSDAPKANEQTALQRRQSTRTRAAVATYNDKELAGTRLHTPRKYLKGAAASSKTQSPAGLHPPTAAAEVEPTDNVVLLENNAVETETVETTKIEIEEREEPSEPTPQSEEPEVAAQRRASSRRRATVVTYNDKENAGTRIHTPTKYIDGTYIRKSLAEGIPGQTPLAGSESVGRHSSTKRPQSSLRKSFTADQLEQDTISAGLSNNSAASGRRDPKRTTDKSSQGPRAIFLASSKRKNAVSRKHAGAGHGDLDDSDSDLSFVRVKSSNKKSPVKRGSALAKRPVKRQRIVEPSPETDLDEARISEIKSGPLRKPWLNVGKFYNTGQDDLVGRLSAVIGHKPKNVTEADREQQNPLFPMPMFSMAEKLDLYPKKKLPESKRPFEPFQLPFEVFSPLPKEVKVRDWRDLKRNEYKGEDAQETRARAKEQRKQARQMEASKCNCIDKCDRDNCFNAVLFFECDDSSCNVGRHCGNRQFSELRKRQQDDYGLWYNKYNIGVEVMETPNRGHGVRAMRTFNKDQIVIEYIGEIITQQESDRRVREVYKDHKCFYLMNFYDKLIIDGYRGNIARFVNHSCNPNCRMEKWTVNGEVRMALFADRYIMTGEELTWHYNFESYGQEQPCYCGSVNCAGVIGRQVRNKPVKEIRDPPSGNNKRKLNRSPVKPKKKPKLTTIAAAASSTVKNIYSKTKSSVGGLLGAAEDPVSLKKTQEKDGRAERAARRSLALQEAEEDDEDDEEEEEDEDEDDESSDDMRTTRSRAGRPPSTASPVKKSPAKRTVTKSRTRVTELTRSSSRRKSSTRVSRSQETRESVETPQQDTPEPLDTPTPADTTLAEDPSILPELPFPKPQTPFAPASSLRKSSSFNSGITPASAPSGLKQTTLSFFGNAFGWKMENPKPEPATKVLRKKSSQDLVAIASGKKGNKRNA